jgi:hypothetical protein
VRKSALFSYTLILMVIPNELLFSILSNYFAELKYWLESKNHFSYVLFQTLKHMVKHLEIIKKGIVLNDSDVECQKKAFECLSILGQRVKGQLIISNNS